MNGSSADAIATDYPQYRVFWSRSQFRGTDVFEIFPGDFSGEITWWNPGAGYVREDALEPFVEILIDITPRLDWYGETRLDGHAAMRLVQRLEYLSRAVDRARTVAELHAAFGNERLQVNEANVLVRRAQLLKMIADLELLAQTAIDKRTGLWLLGL